MNDVEYILDFTANLGSCMLNTGANLERVNDTMNRICLSYRLHSISIFALNSIIIISAKSSDNIYSSRQITVPPASIHLEKLNRLNQLSRKICTETPPPEKLANLLEEAKNTQEYSTLIIIFGHLIAMTSLCVIFGGSLRDIVATDLVTVALFWILRWLSKPNLNHIIVNALCTWLTGTLAILLVKLGIGEHYFIIIITNSMMMIPGIPLVNSFRNILCGNEMNGILEFLKVVLETLAIVLGLFLSLVMFGGTIR